MTEPGKSLLPMVTSTTSNANSNPKSSKGKESKHFRAAVAGACAGALAKTAVAPIERVKLLRQLETTLSNPTYRNKTTIQIASQILRDEGILAFWRGNYHNVLQHSGTSALNFMLMDYYKAMAQRTTNSSTGTMYYSFLCGGLAGSTATTVLYPIQFLRTRLAADVATDGIRQYPRGIYQGYGIAVAGVFLYRSLHLGGYDVLKEWWWKHNRQMEDGMPCHEPHTIPWTEKFIIAQIVSLLAGTVCYPIDTVRRRLMMQAGLENKLFRHAFHAFYGIARTEGILGFFRGLAPNLVRSLGSSLLLLSYDVVLPLL
jgi:solute carrier family 25 (mitochondrial adenine nucleotide translocator), member 4/5/6/31